MERDTKKRLLTLIIAGAVGALPAAGVPPPVGQSAKVYARTICATISREAQRRALPETFFARLIWKESLFDPNAVSPKGAQGIAQFMPATARDRGLADPFHPALALPASAHLLSDLRDRFGNLGLAAAAYNAGEDRVRAWLDGRGGLPAETLDYVYFITGRPANDWTRADQRIAIPAIGTGGSFMRDCLALAARRSRPVLAAVAQGEWKPWGVQLAAGRSESIALASFGRVQARHSALLAGLKPLVLRKRNPAMGRAQRIDVRIGADSRLEAERLCARLRQAGGACLVARN
jgi:hypothetical protein